MTKENELAAMEYLKRYKVNQPSIEMEIKSWDKREGLYKWFWITINVLIGIAMVAIIWA